MSAGVTWAIRYEGIGADPMAPLYITDMPEAGSCGYGYCCPCKETKRFPSQAAAESYMDNHNLTLNHEAVDSIRGAKEKAKRAALKPALPESKKLNAGWEEMA